MENAVLKVEHSQTRILKTGSNKLPSWNRVRTELETELENWVENWKLGWK